MDGVPSVSQILKVNWRLSPTRLWQPLLTSSPDFLALFLRLWHHPHFVSVVAPEMPQICFPTDLSERTYGDPSKAQAQPWGSFLRAFWLCPSCTEYKALRGWASVVASIIKVDTLAPVRCPVTLPPALFPALSTLFIYQNPGFVLSTLWNLKNTPQRINHSSLAPLCTYFGHCNVY